MYLDLGTRFLPDNVDEDVIISAEKLLHASLVQGSRLFLRETFVDLIGHGQEQGHDRMQPMRCSAVVED